MTNRLPRLALASILALLAAANVAQAQRGRGGMVGGGNRGGGAAPRPAANQNFNRPTNVNQNFNRPTNVNQNVNRPTNINQNINRPTNVNQNINRPTNINHNVNRPTNINQNVNRPTNINQNINRPTNINQNINRPTNINQTNVSNRQNVVNNNVTVNNVTNNRVNTNVNNVNRGGYGGYGYGYGGSGGVNRGWGGYGAYGGGYHGGSYYNYHSNWVNGSWGGNFRPAYGGYGGYYGGNNFGNSALGIGAGIGIAAWGVGSLINSWGYSRYSNPYYSSAYAQPGIVASQPVGYDYSRPLDLASAPPSDQVMQTEEASLESARQAFHAGDYVKALALADQALAQTPNDPMLHEFRATCLFAQRRYDEAAVPFYTVLSSGPGWDWTTLIGLYPDVETYTSQLRALEAYCNANPRAASARFVLAALYLTQGSTAAAATRLKEVVAIQPQDKLSAQLLAAITSEGQPAQAAGPAQAAPANDIPPANPNPAPLASASAAAEGPPLPSGPLPANLVGSWTASPSPGVTISLTIPDDKTFAWKLVENGQAREFKGEAAVDQDVLALIAPEMPPMVAKVTWKDPGHFNFKAVATGSDDPGLNFGK